MAYTIRKFKPEDAESIAYHISNPNITRNLKTKLPFPCTIDDIKWYMKFFLISDENTQCSRAIVIGGKAVGSISIILNEGIYRKSASIGFWLGESFWNRGTMSSALRKICNYAFVRYDLARIYAEPLADNITARKALENANFTLEGILKKSILRDDEIMDSCIYAITQ